MALGEIPASSVTVADLYHEPKCRDHPGRVQAESVSAAGQLQLAAQSSMQPRYAPADLGHQEQARSAGCTYCTSGHGGSGCMTCWADSRRDRGRYVRHAYPRSADRRTGSSSRPGNPIGQPSLPAAFHGQSAESSDASGRGWPRATDSALCGPFLCPGSGAPGSSHDIPRLHAAADPAPSAHPGELRGNGAAPGGSLPGSLRGTGAQPRVRVPGWLRANGASSPGCGPSLPRCSPGSPQELIRSLQGLAPGSCSRSWVPGPAPVLTHRPGRLLSSTLPKFTDISGRGGFD